jgi:VCBS repeat-containing protein
MPDAVIAAFNDAETWHEALAAIESSAAALLDDSHLERFNALLVDADREQAIGASVNEIKSLFGDFTSVPQIKAVVERQIDIEYAKHEFVQVVRTANSYEDLRIALGRVQLLHDDREAIIQEWSSSDDQAVRKRAAELAAEPYTLTLRKIAARLGDGAYLDALATQIMSVQEEHGPLGTLGSLIQALDEATDAIGFESIFRSFNEAAGWEAMLAAIKDNASALLDPGHVAKLGELSDEGAYEQAIGLGVAEVRALFGDFTSADQITAAVEKQIDIAHGRFAGLQAINSARDAGSMAAALSLHVARLNQLRQDLIAGWRASGDQDAVARADELEGEAYTIILDEVSSHLGDEAYLAEMAVRMQSARQGSPFLDIDALIAALDMVDRAIDATYDAAISGTGSASINEGDPHSVGGVVTVEDGDWGENRFKTVAESELQKQYGTFAFNSITGEWSFALNSAAQSLKGNRQVHQTLTIESLDGSATATVMVTITGRNDAPEAADSGNSVSGFEDTRIRGQVPAGTDVDGDDLTYTLVQPVPGLTFDDDGTFSYQPAANFSGAVTFQYRAVDAERAESQTRTFTITVNPVNDRPHDIVLSNSHVQENATEGTLVGTLTGYDADGDTLAFSLTNDAGGRFAISKDRLVIRDGVRLDHEQATSHTVTIQVKDGSNATHQETFVIHVNDDTNERVVGSSSADLLKGGSGSDTLWGGLGNDQLTGGSGRDIFVFDTKAHKSNNKDRIVDFKVKDDGIWLDNKVFTKLGKGGSETAPLQLKKEFLFIGTKSKDKNDYVLYDKKKGVLLYDADGSGRGKAVEVATLSKNLRMTEKDFFVI